MRRDGVIAADVSVVRPAVVGLPLTVVALAFLERESAAALDTFARQVRARPEVRQCWYVTGEADWVLVLRLASMEAYEAFTRKGFLADPNVRAFRTLVVMREVVGEMDARPLALELAPKPSMYNDCCPEFSYKRRTTAKLRP